MTDRNPALERVSAKRAAFSEQHSQARPSELLKRQIEEIDVREQEIDASRKDTQAATEKPKSWTIAGAQYDASKATPADANS